MKRPLAMLKAPLRALETPGSGTCLYITSMEDVFAKFSTKFFALAWGSLSETIISTNRPAAL